MATAKKTSTATTKKTATKTTAKATAKDTKAAAKKTAAKAPAKAAKPAAKATAKTEIDFTIRSRAALDEKSIDAAVNAYVLDNASADNLPFAFLPKISQITAKTKTTLPQNIFGDALKSKPG